MSAPDPFAAHQVPSVSQPAQSGTDLADPFIDASKMDDPFAVSSEVRGSGVFVPYCGPENLQGRLIVMIPRSFDPKAQDLNDATKTRELYTVDMYVLNGGRLAYFYNDKGDPEKNIPKSIKEYVVEDVTPENPFVITSHWVGQGNIINGLKQCHKLGRPYLGVMTMVPTMVDRKKGVTPAQTQAQHQQWIAAGKPGQRPQSAWSMEDPTPELRSIAVGWWGRSRAEIKPITPEDHTK